MCHVPATMSPLPLPHRALTFIRIFLREIVQGGKPADAATTAYGESLRKYHNFIVRGIFRCAACPMAYC